MRVYGHDQVPENKSMGIRTRPHHEQNRPSMEQRNQQLIYGLYAKYVKPKNRY